jgi:hypothetical protein
MAGNEHEVLAHARRALGGLEFFRRMIATPRRLGRSYRYR